MAKASINKSELKEKLLIFFSRTQQIKEAKKLGLSTDTINLKTVDIANKNTFYENFNVSVSFGMGKYANVPWFIFLTNEYKASKGIYPYIGVDLENNTVMAHIGFSKQNKVYLEENIDIAINKFNKENSFEFTVDDFSSIGENNLKKLIDLVEKMIKLFNKYSEKKTERVDISTYLVSDDYLLHNSFDDEGIYIQVSNSNHDDFGRTNFYNLYIKYKGYDFFSEKDAIKAIFLSNSSSSITEEILRKEINTLASNNNGIIKLEDIYNDKRYKTFNFISQIQSDLVYRKIAKIFGLSFSKYFLTLIHDAGICKDPYAFTDIIKLRDHEYFDKSLTRSGYAYYAFKKGALFLSRDEYDYYGLNSLDFNFNFKTNVSEDFNKVNLSFKDQEFYKGSINLLIGKNGLGKSFSLKTLADYLSHDNSETLVDLELISQKIAFNKLLILSNVYDDNFVNKKSMLKKNRFNNIDYRYVNLIKNKSFSNQVKKIESISLSSSLKEILKYQITGYEKINKNEILKSIMYDILEFDEVLVYNLSNEKKEILWRSSEERMIDFINSIDIKKDLVFKKSNKILYLSSGQLTFLKYLFHVLAHIEQDSIILIDEPENFLHPNFEMELIKVLYSILDATNSICIIATHSSYIAREISSNYINVFSEFPNCIEIGKPNIETYGSNLERISNYVFSDLDKSGRFHNLNIKEITKNFTYDEIIENYSHEFNSETLSFIRGKLDG